MALVGPEQPAFPIEKRIRFVSGILVELTVTATHDWTTKISFSIRDTVAGACTPDLPMSGVEEPDIGGIARVTPPENWNISYLVSLPNVGAIGASPSCHPHEDYVGLLGVISDSRSKLLPLQVCGQACNSKYVNLRWNSLVAGV